MPRLSLLLAISATILVASCGAGGVGCSQMNLVGLPNRSPVTNATIFSYRVGEPGVRYQGFPLAIPGAYYPTTLSCSGEIMIEITHRDYQTRTVSYRSPRDRTISGNTEVDQFTVELTPR
jgi:hypothetical protein